MDHLRQHLFIVGNVACFAKSLDIAGAESLVRMGRAPKSLWGAKPCHWFGHMLVPFDWRYCYVGRQLHGRSWDHERLDLLRCRHGWLFILFEIFPCEADKVATSNMRLVHLRSCIVASTG